MKYKHLATLDNMVTADVHVPPQWMRGSEVRVPCATCQGSGYRHQYDHVQGGVCFHCDGDGDEFVGTEDDFRWFVARRRLDIIHDAQKRQQRIEFCQRRAERECAQRPLLALLTYPEALPQNSTFLQGLAEKFLTNPNPLSEKQKDTAEKAIREQFARENQQRERRAADQAAKRPAPTGTMIVRGTVISMKTKHERFRGRERTTRRMTVQVPTEDGGHYTVSSSVPAKLLAAAEAEGSSLGGREVQFKATLDHDEYSTDASFVYARRPGGKATGPNPELRLLPRNDNEGDDR